MNVQLNLLVSLLERFTSISKKLKAGFKITIIYINL